MENYKKNSNILEDANIRKGPWTMEEDLILSNYIASHGEGVWNSLAKSAGLKRTGKSCRLRWLNYLRPDLRRGNITTGEQSLIIELHAKWGNRWSKIAKHLPGRTDNDIKNFWRTRIQKHIKQATISNNSDGSSQFSEQAAPSTSQLSAHDSCSHSSCPHSIDHVDTNRFPMNPPTTTTRTESEDNLLTKDEIWSMQFFNED